MAQWYRAFVTIPHDNALPKNTITNSYAFVTAGSGDRDLIAADIDGRLTAFYNGFTTFLSSQYTWANARVQVIDMLDDQPRIPFYDAALSLTEPLTTVNDLPPEVSIVLSIEGAKTSGVNMRRRRGRVYLGPFQVGSADQHEVQSGLVSAIVTSAGANLLNPTMPAGLSDLAIYSRYTHHDVPVGTHFTNEDDFPEVPDLLPASFTPATRVWVDNAWDTQRRRGVSASSRTIVVAT